MLTTLTSRDLTIAPGATLHFINPEPQRLSVRSSGGYVWLTRDGDIKDYLLQAGDAISLCAGDHVWLTLERAEQAGSVTLEPSEAAEAPRPFWRNVAGLLSMRAATPCNTGVVTAPREARA